MPENLKQRREKVCGKGTTFTVLWTNQTLSLCLLCFATLAAMTALCEIFNLLHFRSTPKVGAGMAQVAQW